MVAAVAGCDYFDRSLRPGSYRATLETPVGELPFGLDVAQESDRFVLFLVNGEDRVRVDDVRVDDRTLRRPAGIRRRRSSCEVRRRALAGA